MGEGEGEDGGGRAQGSRRVRREGGVGWERKGERMGEGEGEIRGGKGRGGE